MKPKTFFIEERHMEEMKEMVSLASPEEGCGLVAGKDGVSTAVFTITNELHSSVRFRMDPHEQLKAFMAIESHGWDLLAIFHSHPNGPNFPSETDLDEFAYPGVFYLIWFLQDLDWTCRCFEIVGFEVDEVKVIIS